MSHTSPEGREYFDQISDDEVDAVKMAAYHNGRRIGLLKSWTLRGRKGPWSAVPGPEFTEVMYGPNDWQRPDDWYLVRYARRPRYSGRADCDSLFDHESYCECLRSRDKALTWFERNEITPPPQLVDACHREPFYLTCERLAQRVDDALARGFAEGDLSFDEQCVDDLNRIRGMCDWEDPINDTPWELERKTARQAATLVQELRRLSTSTAPIPTNEVLPSPDTPTAEDPSPDNGAGDDAEVENLGLSPSREKAYRLYGVAVEQGEGIKTDGAAFEWLSARSSYRDELPPTLSTFSRYLREAPAHYDARKNEPRSGRGHGSSIAREQDI